MSILSLDFRIRKNKHILYHGKPPSLLISQSVVLANEQ